MLGNFERNSFLVQLKSRVKKSFHILLLWALLPMISSAQENAVERDGYFWGFYEFEFEVHKDWVFNFKNQVRLNENATRFDYSAFDLGLTYEAAKWVKLTATYRYSLKNHWRDKWLNRHQFRGTISLRHRIDDFKFYNRSRFQTGVEDAFGIGETGASDFFYRNRTRVKYNITNRWDVYAFFEAYFRMGPVEAGDDYVYRTRFGAGANYEINSRESIRIFVVQDEQVRRSRPSQRYFVGFGYMRTIDLH